MNSFVNRVFGSLIREIQNKVPVEFHSLNQQLADEPQESSTANGKNDERKIEESNRRVSTDIAEAIRSQRFSVAESLVLEMNDNDKISNIIHEVYADSKENVGIILDFAEALSNIDISYYVLSALLYKMRANGYEKTDRMMNLVKELDKRVVNLPSFQFTTLFEGDIIYSTKYISQAVSILVALFWKLHRVNDLNNSAVLSIGDYLKRLQGMKNFANLSAEKKSAINRVVKCMPTCAKNLLFSKKVCIVNRAFPEHLYAASSQYQPFFLETERRSVFTGCERESVNQGYWYVEKLGHQFHFRNTVYNEYMYAATYRPYSENERNVWTWILGNRVIESAWTVELDGNYCYLKNNYFNEYLYASNKTYDFERRRVFTWIKGSGVRGQGFQWQITAGK